jgi:hypothetical protein
LNWVMLPKKVLDTEKNTSCSFRVMSQSKCNNSKLRQDRVTVLCTAHLPNDIYLPTKFLVHISYSVTVMFQTKFKM